MNSGQISTKKLLIIGLFTSIIFQLYHVISFTVIPLFDLLYNPISNSKGFNENFIDAVGQYYLLMFLSSLLLIISPIFVEISTKTDLSKANRLFLFISGFSFFLVVNLVEISLLSDFSSKPELWGKYIVSVLILYIPSFIVAMIFIGTAFLDTEIIHIEKNIKKWFPTDITTTGIFKTGIIIISLGIFLFNVFLVLGRTRKGQELPFISKYSVLIELLLITIEIMLVGIFFLIFSILCEISILKRVQREHCDLKSSTKLIFLKIQTMSKKTLVGIILISIILIFIEQGIILQRFGDQIGKVLNPIFEKLGLPFHVEEIDWTIDPLLNFLDYLFETTNALIEPIFSLIGIDFELKPLFKEGNWRSSPAALNRVILRNLGEGAIMTLLTSLAALFLGLILATFCGTIRVTSYIPIPFVGRRISTYFTNFLRDIVTAYVEFFRSTPLMAQIFFMMFGVPALVQSGIPLPLISYIDGEISFLKSNSIIGTFQISDFRFDFIGAGILALTLNTAAYQSEIIRSGIQAIPSGQLEAARSLGMPYSQGMQHVVLPQAFRLIIPPLTNEFINLILNSSLLSVISVFEMTREARNMNNSLFRSFEIFGWLMICYFVMTFTLSRIFRRVEEKSRIPGLGVSE